MSCLQLNSDQHHQPVILEPSTMKVAKLIFLLIFYQPIAITAISFTDFMENGLQNIKNLFDFTKENHESNVINIGDNFSALYNAFEFDSNPVKIRKEDIILNIGNSTDLLLSEMAAILKGIPVYVKIPKEIPAIGTVCTNFTYFSNLFDLQALVMNYCYKRVTPFFDLEPAFQASVKGSDDKSMVNIATELGELSDDFKVFYAQMKATNDLLRKYLFKFTEIFGFGNCLETLPCGEFWG
jgi:hypothetical protein